MKSITALSALFASLFISGSVFANPLTLFDYTVYAKNTISAECSDFQGRTAAGGAVFLQDFTINLLPSQEQGCALESDTSIRWTRGSTTAASGAYESCVGAPFFPGGLDTVDTESNNYATADFNGLNRQMDALSAKLSSPFPNANVKQITLNINPIHSGGYLTLTGSPQQLLVVNVPGTNVSIQRYGIKLLGGLTPANIIWNFPNAQTLLIEGSGNDQYGMPGTFLAPNAQVTFLSARITGALFAGSIVGMANSYSCDSATLNAGQINGICLNGLIAGMGCGAYTPPAPTPTPYPTPCPLPTPPTCDQCQN